MIEEEFKMPKMRKIRLRNNCYDLQTKFNVDNRPKMQSSLREDFVRICHKPMRDKERTKYISPSMMNQFEKPPHDDRLW